MFNRILLPLAVAALSLGSAVAFAEDTTTTGVVQSVDTTAQTLTLQDGGTFAYAADVDVSALKEGDKVTLDVQETEGTTTVVKVTPAE